VAATATAIACAPLPTTAPLHPSPSLQQKMQVKLSAPMSQPLDSRLSALFDAWSRKQGESTHFFVTVRFAPAERGIRLRAAADKKYRVGNKSVVYTNLRAMVQHPV
jgi:hypothetical protein